ncbi:lysine exporter LysO family protein [Odoribacter lunatus]|uniref:lysine exporter LysO family protein n=1 Tax=Odoribacter lunatus TaxID=2941335 RepID=UPI00203E1764|nr:lysine exporter LysO family protein [Odoribacter lunatus]
MRESLIIGICFFAGVLLGRLVDIPGVFIEGEGALYVLYVLMFLVGVSIGRDREVLQALRQQHLKIVLVPLATIVGTLAGVAVISCVIQGRSLIDCLAVGVGFGYYSLSSVFITQYKGAELGTIALVANVLRELFALLTAPWLVRYFGKLAPISVGGATSMDTTLPVITRYSGKEFVVISMVHGMTVDFCVPFLVTFFCTI